MPERCHGIEHRQACRNRHSPDVMRVLGMASTVEAAIEQEQQVAFETVMRIELPSGGAAVIWRQPCPGIDTVLFGPNNDKRLMDIRPPLCPPPGHARQHCRQDEATEQPAPPHRGLRSTPCRQFPMRKGIEQHRPGQRPDHQLMIA
ncbi:hypothetical protein DYGSA30_28530 [Dyella sp. GSA-30]|nr:hypothetical protein DYGSA30_28530 [Dyella sp. GSA-30]